MAAPELNAAALGDNRTIAAIATAMGRGALALVRASGPGVPALAEALLDPVPRTPRRATFCTVRDASGMAIDDVMATLLVGPESFTGEDMLELCTHGGQVVPIAVLAAMFAAGARQAEPGEFTRRAVLNGKIDLLQAEAIGDLIDARSSAAHRQALRQLDGGLSRRVESLREQLLRLEALLAYDIDFPDEDDGPVPRSHIIALAQEVLDALDVLLASGTQGALVHDGALVVLAGAPNTGKSSLFNALLGEARAIVTELPGTTRDAIEAMLDLPGWPLRLVDTAGLRATTDLVEQLGIEASERYLARAELILVCLDSPDAETEIARNPLFASTPVLRVATKCDLVTNRHEIDADVHVSAKTGEGVAELLRIIEVRLAATRGAPALDAPVLNRIRHKVAVRSARAEVESFLHAWDEGLLPSSVAATHVRSAAEALSELIGVIQVDDVLDVVFRSFCVGK